MTRTPDPSALAPDPGVTPREKIRDELEAADAAIGEMLDELRHLAFNASDRMRKHIPGEDWPIMISASVTRMQAQRERVQLACRLARHDAMFTDAALARRASLPTAQEEAPYKFEVDDGGCDHCGRGRSWTVVGPDGVAIGWSFDDPDDAESLRDCMNEAFRAGLAASRAREEVQIELRQPYPIWGRLGVGAEAWVELEDIERRGIAQRNNDRSGMTISWRTFQTVLNALRHCGEHHYRAASRSIPAPTPEK